MRDLIKQALASESFWTISAVLVGFLLGEGSAFLRHCLRIRRMKRVLLEEMKSVLAQIDQKKDIITKARALLESNRILPTRSVPIIAAGYAANITELYPYLTAQERNSLHVIYERLKTADDIMNTFDKDITDAIRDKVMDEPFKAFSNRLRDIDESYEVVKRLISAHQSGKPTDVFYLEDEGGFSG